MIDSAAISSQTPTQASQPPNVRKCPVLSGPTVLIGFTTASIDSLMTYRHKPPCTDRTSVRSSPLPTSRPPSQSPSPSPSGCRISVAVAWRPTLRAASCLRVFVVKRENQKVTRQPPTQVSQPHNVRKCPVLSGPSDLSQEIHASPDNQTTCAQTPPTRTGH